MGFFDFLIELLETFVLGCETAFGGRVDDEDYFSFVFGEGDGLAFLIKRLEVVEACCGSHGSFLSLSYVISLSEGTGSADVEKW